MHLWFDHPLQLRRQDLQGDLGVMPLEDALAPTPTGRLSEAAILQ
jgi:hypothetical protein